MKKLLFLLGAATALSAAAANPIITSDELDMTAPELTASNNGLFSVPYVDYEQENYSPSRLVVYDNAFNELADINFPEAKTITYTRYENGNSQTYSGYEFEVVRIGYYKDNVEKGWMYPTQTLFNNDSQIEYVIANFTKEKFSYDTSWGGQYSGEQLAVTSFSVMNQKHEKILDIKLPEGYYASAEDHDLRFITLGNKQYICILAQNNPYYECYPDFFILYELDATGGIKAPKVVKGSLKVTPSAPRHGETVSVDLGEAADGATVVNLVSANGSTVRTLPVGNGQQNISFSTAGLTSGLYIVTANGREAAKIIIR